MSRVVAGFMLMLASMAPVFAGAYTGLVRPFYYGSSLYIDTSQAQASDKPACATRTYVDLQETDPTSQVFKNKFAMLLAAWYSGQPVTLNGTGQCTSKGDEIIFAVSPVTQ